MPPRAKDMTGQRVGRWLVIERAGSSARYTARWLCRCDCGRERIVTGTSLREGSSTGCKSCQMQKNMVAMHVAAGHDVRPWTVAELALLGTMSDRNVAKLIGRKPIIVAVRRNVAGIPKYRPKGHWPKGKSRNLSAEETEDARRVIRAIANRMTATEIGHAIGVGRSTVHKWLTGTRMPPPLIVVAFRDLLESAIPVE